LLGIDFDRLYVKEQHIRFSAETLEGIYQSSILPCFEMLSLGSAGVLERAFEMPLRIHNVPLL
jgi:hypothetical protein